MNVSIIIPIYNPNIGILKQIEKRIKNQDLSGKIEIIKVNKGLGLADSLNYGIKKAKYDIIVSLHQDCIPSSKDWLRKLIEPLKQKDTVAAASKTEIPYGFWNNFDWVGKILSEKEQKIITPLLDEKGCAYRKSALLKVGLFDGKRFRTAGEDVDMYLKIRKFGKIAFPDAKVIHYHEHNINNRLKKELQLSNCFGAHVRIYGIKLYHWHIGIIKSIPILGWPVFLAGINIKRLKFLSIPAIPLYLLVNIIYSYGFWKGFLMGRQTV